MRSRRMMWALADQGFSSATNFLGAVAAARKLDSEGFGAFGVAFAVYLIALGISRSWSSEPLTVRFARASIDEQQHGIGSALGTAAFIGAIVGALCAAAALVVDGPMRSVLLVLALALPLLLAQDMCRYALVLQDRQRAAALNDLTWLVVQLAAISIWLGLSANAAGATLVWASGGIAGAFLGAGQLKLRPSLHVVRWIRQVGDLSIRFMAEFVLVTGTAYLLVLGISSFAGLSEAGQIRAAQVLFGPLNVVFLGASLQSLPAFTRVAGASGLLRRRCVRLSTLLSSLALAWGLVVLVLPDSVGAKLLGESWPNSKPLIVFTTVSYAALAMTLSATLAIRALGAAAESLRTRVRVAFIPASLGLMGALAGGATGAVGGLAVGNLLSVPIWWGTLSRSLAPLNVRTDTSATPAVPRDGAYE